MDICIIINHLESKNPAIKQLEECLQDTYTIRRLPVLTQTLEEAIAEDESHPSAALYILKSHTREGIALGHYLEQRGATVINSPKATSICDDRALTQSMLEAAHLTSPRTLVFSSLEKALADQNWMTDFPFPLIIKGRYCEKKQPVTKVDTLEELQAAAEIYGAREIIIQECLHSDDMELKIWVVDEQVFAQRRTYQLATGRSRRFQLAEDEIPAAVTELAINVGRTLGLQIFGMDMLTLEQGPVVLDINAFHGCYGIFGFDDAFVAWVERILQQNSESTPVLVEG